MDPNVLNAVWSKDGRSYYVSMTVDGKSRMWSSLHNRRPLPIKHSATAVRITVMSVMGNWVAFGTHDGEVIVVDLDSLHQCNLELVHCAITALGFSESGDLLLVGSDDGDVREYRRAGENWTLKPTRKFASGVGTVTAIHIEREKVYLAVKGGSKVVCYSFTNALKLKQYPKIPAPPIFSILQLNRTESVISAYKHRQITIYNEKGDFNLMCPSQPVSMSINPYRPYSNHLLCVTQLGTVAVWNITIEGMNNTVPHTTIQSKKQFVRAAQFVSDTEIVVIYGPKAVFQMETVKYFENNEFVENIELDAVVSLLSQEQKAKKKQKALEPEKKKSRKHVNRIGPQNMKLPSVTTTDVELLPFGERLAPLVLPTSESQPTYNLRLESMENVLVQGLKSRDITLVNSVLSVTLPEIIKKTVQKLPQAYVVPYMTLLIKQFPENSSTIPWIQELIHHHLTFLMTVPQFVKKFSYLYGILDGRVSNFNQLVKTKSRLEYLMSQKSYQPDESKKYIMVTPTPLKVFNEVEQADPVWNEWAVCRDGTHERKSRKRKRGLKNIVGLVEGDVDDEDEDEEQVMERERERENEARQEGIEKKFLENQLWMADSEEEEEDE